MSFLHPALAAFALACIAIPIVIHFFMRRRRRPVMFGAMRFLIEAYKRQRRRLMLEQFLLLLVRCAVFVLLALAIGRLVLGDAPSLEGSRTAYILIDNSLTASASDADGSSALDRHKRRAIEALGELDALTGDRAGLVLLASPIESLVVPATGDLARVRRAIEGVEVRDSACDIDGAIALVGALAREDRGTIVLLSDWLEGSLGEGGRSPADASLEVGSADRDGTQRVLVSTPMESGPANISIVEVSPRRRVLIAQASGGLSGVGQALIRLRRAGSADMALRDVPISLSIERADAAARVARGTIRFESGQREASGIVAFALSDALSGSASLLARIDGPIEGNAIIRDDARRAPVELRRELRVGILSERTPGAVEVRRFEPADWVGVALEPARGEARPIEVRSIPPASIDAARLAQIDALIVVTPERVSESARRSIAEFVRTGGLVLLTPDARAQSQRGLADLLDELRMPWRVNPEAREIAGEDGPRAIDPASLDPAGLLGVLAGEIEELAQPVSIDRVMGVDGPPDRDVVVRLDDASPLLLHGSPAGSIGSVALLLTALDPAWTTLPAKPLMVPLLQEIVRQGVGGQSGVSAIAGRSFVPASDVRALEGISEGAPDVALGERDVSSIALGAGGLYRAIGAEAGQERLLIVNPDADAGTTDPTPAEALRGLLARGGREVLWLDGQGETAGGASSREAGISLSLNMLLLALALGVIETLLARRASHAGVDSEERP